MLYICSPLLLGDSLQVLNPSAFEKNVKYGHTRQHQRLRLQVVVLHLERGCVFKNLRELFSIGQIQAVEVAHELLGDFQ
jgi:hypothetical protein